MSNNNFPTFADWRRDNFHRLAYPHSSDTITNLFNYIVSYAEFSEKTFGTGLRTMGVTEHIRKELDEIAADPLDAEEWIDVIILALDGVRRTGTSPLDICALLTYKMEKNKSRKWPPHNNEDVCIEHVRD